MKILRGYKKQFIIATAIVVIMSLFFVLDGRENAQQEKPRDVKSQLLYDSSSQKIMNLTTDSKTKKFVDFLPWNTTNNQFQYSFHEYSNLYTNGNSEKNDFSILQLGEKVKTIFRLKNNNEAIFPMYIDEKGAQFFILVKYNDKKEEISHEVVRFNKEKSEVLPVVSNIGKVMDGVISKGVLTYSVYNSNRQDYDILEMNLKSKKGKALVRNVNSYELYKIGNEIYRKTDNNVLTSILGKKTYPAGYTTTLYHHYLLNVTVGEDSTEDLEIVNSKTSKKLASFANTFGFDIVKDVLTVYRRDGNSIMHLD